jgi:Uma2 family endonuclease
MATSEKLITAERFARMPERDRPTELVRGRILEMNPPGPRHGQICAAVYRSVGNYATQHKLGHVLINDSGVVTERDPDTVRGADVAFYRYERVADGPLPDYYLSIPPDLVFEVLSPGDRRGRLLTKVAEYLNAGVTAVCVLDDQTKTVQIFFANQPFETLFGDDELTLPEILGQFRVCVREFFV